MASEAAGVVVIVVTSASVARTLLLPGSRVGFLLRKIDQGTDHIFRLAGRFTSTHERRSRFRSMHAPMILAAQLWSWLGLYFLGYALLLWPQTGQLARALKESGSSLLTLGFAATGRGTAVAIDLLAATTGLIVVALQIAYLPTLYNAFNRREADVALLAVRAGQPAWGPELLARSHLMGAVSELPALYATWERWAAEVAESHSSYPVLLRFRAANPLSSWLTGFVAVLDSAALYASIATDGSPLQARLFLRMGFGCLQQLADTVGIAYDPDPRPDAGIRLTEAEFQQGIDRLRAYDFPIDRPVEEIWIHFQGWRVNYESIVYNMALQIDAPPALWSGPRRQLTPQIAPKKLLDRTPEDPQGAKPVKKGRKVET
ncbi:MAG: hypothetical protein QOJ93_1900 [Actinomycetota bacterium]|jgi:hypothetical protein|nr:hypothetical protein [Actinomycetota bacterium]